MVGIYRNDIGSGRNDIGSGRKVVGVVAGASIDIWWYSGSVGWGHLLSSLRGQWGSRDVTHTHRWRLLLAVSSVLVLVWWGWFSHLVVAGTGGIFAEASAVVGGTLEGGKLAFALAAGRGSQDVVELVDSAGMGLELGGDGESGLWAHWA